MDSFYNRIGNIVSASATAKQIVIVGKGASLSLIDHLALKGSFIINVNDSERYAPGDLTLFHAGWVLEALQEEGFRNKFYVCPQDVSAFLPIGSEWIYAPYQPANNEGAEHIAGEFSDDRFSLSDFLLISALKLCRLIHLAGDKALPVYLIGFDFEYNSQSDLPDISGHDAEYKNILLRTQRENYRFIHDYLVNALQMPVVHVGKQAFSGMSVEIFNRRIEEVAAPHQLSFDNHTAYRALLEKTISEQYVLVVAEFTNNHIGDADRLVKMIRAAKRAGADMVKVQKRQVDSFYTKEELATYYKSPFGTTLEDYRRGVELDDRLMQILIEECAASEIVWFASVLDYPSLQYMQQYNPPLIKLPSTISNHRNFLRKAAKDFSGDLVVSTGFSDSEYEDFILSTFTGERNLFLLQCTSSYPTPPEACQIAVVRHYEEMRSVRGVSNIWAGYSSHDLGSLGCMMAVAAGARMLEKHVKLGNLDWIHFDGVALDLLSGEFEQFVKDIRKAQKMCGTKAKQIHYVEHHKYKTNEQHN